MSDRYAHMRIKMGYAVYQLSQQAGMKFPAFLLAVNQSCIIQWSDHKFPARVVGIAPIAILETSKQVKMEWIRTVMSVN